MTTLAKKRQSFTALDNFAANMSEWSQSTLLYSSESVYCLQLWCTLHECAAKM